MNSLIIFETPVPAICILQRQHAIFIRIEIFFFYDVHVAISWFWKLEPPVRFRVVPPDQYPPLIINVSTGVAGLLTQHCRSCIYQVYILVSHVHIFLKFYSVKRYEIQNAFSSFALCQKIVLPWLETINLFVSYSWVQTIDLPTCLSTIRIMYWKVCYRLLAYKG